MKDFRSKVSVKICAWLLFALSALSCCVSVFGIGVLLLSDSYFDGGRELRYAVASDFFYSIDKKRIDKYTENVLNKVPNIDEYEYDYIFSKENCNIFFTVTDDNGILIIDHGDDAEYCEKFTYDENFYFDGRVIGVSERYFDAKTEAEEYISAMCAEYNVINYTITEIESYEYEQEYASRDNDGISISEKPITEIASNTDDTANVRYKVHIQYDESDFITYHVTVFIRKDFTAKDKYYYFLGATRLLCNIRFEIIFIALACAVLCLFIVVFLCSAAGHKKNKDGIYLSGLHKIPLDIYLCICFFGVICLLLGILFILEEILSISSGYIYVMTLLLAAPVCIMIAASAIVTFAVRVKHGKWWRNTLIYHLIILIKKIIVALFGSLKYAVNHISIYWKALLLFCGVKIIELTGIFLGIHDIWIAESLIFGIFLIYFVISLNKLQKGSKEMANGNLDYHVDVEHMAHSLRDCGENLNNMSNGLKTALDEKMKSEHMKTELITNVSHDIKTPLTSIVNYVGLLKRDGLDSPSAQEYLDVIERQSKRLKKLTEDLIEASKATSGCINVNAEYTDVNVLLSQAVVEYSDRFEASDLEIVMDISPDNPVIFADGRLLWRVFDNLFNNIRKYSLGGTRVYIRSEVIDDKCVVSFTNISKEKLNISSDELMERFVRGDSSRNTEGSGLGLSIARSLTDLQGGKFDISIDGDLFKAIVTFDIIKKNAEA